MNWSRDAGLHKQQTSTDFLSDWAVMNDVLRELQGLFLRQQRRDTSLVDASRHILPTIEVVKLNPKFKQT